MTNETKKMVDIINNQHEEYRKQIAINNKKQERKQTIAKILSVGIIGLAIIVLLIANARMTDKYMESCQEAGHSYNYCIEHS